MMISNHICYVCLMLISTVELSKACPVETISKQAIINTTWIATATVESCGFWVFDGEEIITIENTLSGDRIVIAQGNHVWETQLESSQSHQLKVTIPNQTDIVEINHVVAGIDLQFVYTPKDDQEYRKNYRLWFNDPRNAQNEIWYCKTIFPTFSESQKIQQNNTYTFQFGDGKNSYCL